MKAKDIALLCTAAAGAGAAAAAMSAKSKSAKKPAKNNGEKIKAEKQEKAAVYALTAVEGIDCGQQPVYTGGEAATLIGKNGRERNAWRIIGGEAVQVRCPSAVISAASMTDCTLFITDKGGIFVYSDSEKEPVFCGLTDPEYVCTAHGKFYVFSDSLLYICSEGGEIETTVSLSGMVEMTIGDICDAECSDGSFSDSRIAVKKAYPFSNGFTAVITGDGRSYLMHCDDENFYSFEKTYENVTDVCSFDNFAYYLCKIDEGYGIIKTRIYKDKCETMAKYLLCADENEPVRIVSGKYGLGILYADGTVKFLLPELSDSRRKNKYKNELKGINAAVSEIKSEDIISCGGEISLLSGGKVYIVNRL